MRNLTTRIDLAGAIEAVDRANALDPRLVPRAYAEGIRAYEWTQRLAPNASEALLLAARAHHLDRWAIPRTDLAVGKAGYHRWRTMLRRVQAESIGEVLLEVGVHSTTVRRVQELVRKEGLGTDPEAQALEDAVCLTFLETQADELAERLDDERMINALRKSISKMSEVGRALASEAKISPRCTELLARALQPEA